MAFTLETVLPWGRSLDEYRHIFSLTDEDPASAIRGCGIEVALEAVPYESHRGAHHMMRIRSPR